MNQKREKMRGEPIAEQFPASEVAGTPEHDLLRGLVYLHNRANANTAAAHEANAALSAVVELLVERGLVDREAFEARRAILRGVAARLPGSWHGRSDAGIRRQ
jgi:hypothetical protein